MAYTFSSLPAMAVGVTPEGSEPTLVTLKVPIPLVVQLADEVVTPGVRFPSEPMAYAPLPPPAMTRCHASEQSTAMN